MGDFKRGYLWTTKAWTPAFPSDDQHFGIVIASPNISSANVGNIYREGGAGLRY